MEEPAAQVKVYFTTTHEDLQLPESKRQLLVPADIKRYGLSRILNSESMLNTPAPIPLDFLVNGQFLRTPLDEYLQTNGLSLESTVTLQYVRSLLPPVYEASFEYDDWISCVDVLSSTSPAGRWSGDAFHQGRDRVLSASFDGLIRIWNSSGEALATSPASKQGGHSRRVNGAKFLSATQVVSTGLDQRVIVWEYAENRDGTAGSLKPKLELYGHKKMVNSINVHGAARRMLTASSDGHIGLWSATKPPPPPTDPDSLPATYSNVRPSLKTASTIGTKQGGSLAMIKLHDERVKEAVFHPEDQTVAYAVSTDHTLRTVDLTTAKTVSTITTLNPLFCVSALAGRSLVAAAGAAGHISLIDPRESATTTSVMTLRGHVNFVNSLCGAPNNDYSLLSASHDSTCRVWDLRSTRPATSQEGSGSVCEPAYMIPREWLRTKKKLPTAGEGAKVFSAVWDETWGIVSAGEDKKVQINRGRDLVSAS